MPLILILVGNFFVLILALIGAQMCYFERRWLWFWMTAVAAIVSGACIADEAYQVWFEPTHREMLVNPPTSPL